MGQSALNALAFVTAVACGLIAGVFFAFSSFIMAGLGRIPAPQGAAAMQSINVTVINPVFMGVFLGAGVASLVLIIGAFRGLAAPGAVWMLAGGLLYLVGSIGVTMVLNVPLNNALAAVDPASTEGAQVWARYLTDWTFWNTVRGIASLAATAALIQAMLVAGAQV